MPLQAGPVCGKVNNQSIDPFHEAIEKFLFNSFDLPPLTEGIKFFNCRVWKIPRIQILKLCSRRVLENFLPVLVRGSDDNWKCDGESDWKILAGYAAVSIIRCP